MDEAVKQETSNSKNSYFIILMLAIFLYHLYENKVTKYLFLFKLYRLFGKQYREQIAINVEEMNSNRLYILCDQLAFLSCLICHLKGRKVTGISILK